MASHNVVTGSYLEVCSGKHPSRYCHEQKDERKHGIRLEREDPECEERKPPDY